MHMHGEMKERDLLLNCCPSRPAPSPLFIICILLTCETLPQEVSILSKLAHRHVVRFIGACTRRPNLCIVCELMPGGSVSDLLRRVRRVMVSGGSVTCCEKHGAVCDEPAD